MRRYINTANCPDSSILVGFDVHKATIAACVLNRATGEIDEASFKNTPSAVRRFVGRVREGRQREGRRLGQHDQTVLAAYLGLIDYLEAEVRHLEERIDEEAESPRFREAVRVLSAFRGIATITALTLATELGDIRRFGHPRQLMGYLGLVPGERTSGEKTIRTSITKAGNRYARKAIVSAAWKYATQPTRSQALKKRQALLPAHLAPRVITTSWKAQRRLHKRFHALAFRKQRSVAAVAVARELAGFLWEAMQLSTARPVSAQAA